MMQSFGGPWTLLKLEILEKYLNFYINALKNKKFKLCYIDAFAGSGNVDVKGIGTIPGSAVRVIDYPFDKYIFIEKDIEYAKRLEEMINKKNSKKNVEIKIGDCNRLLETSNSISWYQNYWRGIIFLDPYAMNLNWASLEAIAQTKAFDIWYLFPLCKRQRKVRKNGSAN
ncbi:MAG: three-Cys-motif partner protein TcmP [Bacillota bacterium]|nr:three-Cys-motif partner protein TcmP [Bacillota bacterium]